MKIWETEEDRRRQKTTNRGNKFSELFDPRLVSVSVFLCPFSSVVFSHIFYWVPSLGSPGPWVCLRYISSTSSCVSFPWKYIDWKGHRKKNRKKYKRHTTLVPNFFYTFIFFFPFKNKPISNHLRARLKSKIKIIRLARDGLIKLVY